MQCGVVCDKNLEAQKIVDAFPICQDTGKITIMATKIQNMFLVDLNMLVKKLLHNYFKKT